MVQKNENQSAPKKKKASKDLESVSTTAAKNVKGGKFRPGKELKEIIQ